MQFTTEEVRTIIKFGHFQGKTAPAIQAELIQVLGEEEAPSLATVKRWASKFRDGNSSVEDAPRSGRPATATDESVVGQVRDLVAEDRRLTVEEISAEVGISTGSAWDILHNKLNKRKKCARWVPHVLTEEQKACRVSISSAHLARFKREGDAFLNRVVAGDETWIRSYEPLLKRQSAEWRSPGSPRPKKAVRGMAKLKTMHVIFYSSSKVLCDYAVPPGTTVNGALCRWILIHKLALLSQGSSHKSWKTVRFFFTMELDPTERLQLSSCSLSGAGKSWDIRRILLTFPHAISTSSQHSKSLCVANDLRP